MNIRQHTIMTQENKTEGELYDYCLERLSRLQKSKEESQQSPAISLN